MPNWCSCDLYVRGEKKELARFKKAAKGKNGVIDFNNFIPYPKKFTDMDEKAKEANKKIEPGKTPAKDGYNSGGYEWCIANWGTKWNASSPEISDDLDEELAYRLETAWSPPAPVVQKMGEMFPALEFELRYFEAGMSFNGLMRIEKGKVTADMQGEYFGDRGG